MELNLYNHISFIQSAIKPTTTAGLDTFTKSQMEFEQSLHSTPKQSVSDIDNNIKTKSSRNRYELRYTPIKQHDPSSFQKQALLPTFISEHEMPTDDDLMHNLGAIESNVGEALNELSSTYKTIGYSSREIASKKTEIFTAIHTTINNFAESLQREQTTIENECEWLRQQILIILAMINDQKGDKSLNLLQRGLVFANEEQYSDGYKQDILTKLSNSNYFLPVSKEEKGHDDDDGQELTIEQ